MIVRAKPGSGAFAQVRRILQQLTGSCLVFFHGPAATVTEKDVADWGIADKCGELSLRVCSAAWARQGRGALSARLEPASLTVFWNLTSQADLCISIGSSVWESATKLERFVVVLTSRGDATYWCELLELVLAGASLDLDLVVVFGTEALDSLGQFEREFQAWRQLVDHELASVRVVCRSDHSLNLPDWIVPASELEAMDLRRERAEILG